MRQHDWQYQPISTLLSVLYTHTKICEFQVLATYCTMRDVAKRWKLRMVFRVFERYYVPQSDLGSAIKKVRMSHVMKKESINVEYQNTTS